MLDSTFAINFEKVFIRSDAQGVITRLEHIAMSQINVAIASDCMLAYVGLTKILEAEEDISISDKVTSFTKLLHTAPIIPHIILTCPITIYNMGIDRIKNLCKNHPDLKLIVFNIDPKDENVMIRLLKIGVMGVINNDDTPSIFAKAIRAVYRGEMWIKRKTMLEVIRSSNKNKVRAPLKKLKGLFTPREVEIMTLIAEGHKNKTIAERLCISEHTVKFHVQNIFKKLDVKTRLEAALYYHAPPQETGP